MGDIVYVAEADADRPSAVNVGTGQAVTVTANLERSVGVVLDEPNAAVIVLESRFPDYHLTRVNLVTFITEVAEQVQKNPPPAPQRLSLSLDQLPADLELLE